MVQDQLVEYINSQLKAGVTADAVKAALLGAGWQAADVDDTMKKVQGAPAAGPSSPAAAGPAASMGAGPSVAASSMGASPARSASPTGGPQVIRVSDLVSTSGSSSSSTSPFGGAAAKPSSMPGSFSPSAMTGAKTDAVMSKIAAGARPVSMGSVMGSTPATAGASANATTSPASATASMSAKPKRTGVLATESVLGGLMVIFGAIAVFLFFQNQGLSSQIASVNGQSSGVSSQIASLQQQLTASTTALEAQVASATAASAQLGLELSFYAVPAGTQATTTFTTALKGTVSGGGRYAYVITTPDGVKVTVSNSKDTNVIDLLKPLAAATTTVAQFAGNYVPGIASISLTAVNGQTTTPPPATSTTTATSSAAAGTGTSAAPMIPATTTGK